MNGQEMNPTQNEQMPKTRSSDIFASISMNAEIRPASSRTAIVKSF
jgi:hypothetical protein